MFVITLKTLANALRLVFLAGIALAPVSLCICEPGASAPSSLINGVVPVGWGEAHLSQIHVECLYNETSIAFHTL